jgi:hypothetical protein
MFREFSELGKFLKNKVSKIHPNFEISENRKLVNLKKILIPPSPKV